MWGEKELSTEILSLFNIPHLHSVVNSAVDACKSMLPFFMLYFPPCTFSSSRKARASPLCSFYQAGWLVPVHACVFWLQSPSGQPVPASRLLGLSNIVTLWIAQCVVLATLEELGLIITQFTIVYCFVCDGWKNSDIYKRINVTLPCAFALITFLPWFL